MVFALVAVKVTVPELWVKVAEFAKSPAIERFSLVLMKAPDPESEKLPPLIILPAPPVKCPATWEKPEEPMVMEKLPD